jgi:predicted metal-dependent peptidase
MPGKVKATMNPENRQRIDRIRRVTLAVGWRSPFFLIPFNKMTLRIDPSVKTACVSRRGVVRFGPEFVDKLTDRQLAGVACHEVMHPTMGHFARMGSRDPMRWNRAGDRAINAILVASGIELPEGALLPANGQESWTAEQFYDVEPESDDGDPDMDPGDGDGDGEDLPGDGEDPSDGGLPTDREWSEVAHQAAAIAGNSAGAAAFRGALVRPPTRVRWRDVLRGACARAVAAHGHDDTSFAKYSKRSGAVIYPGPIAHRALVAVVIDTSGSVPDAALETALVEVCEISRLAPEVEFYLVTHDAVIQWQGWIQGGKRGDAKIRGAIKGRGGTMFDPAYRAIESAGKKFDAMVHLTDGEPCDGSWPVKPRNVRKPVAALIGCASRGAIPEGWRVIEVERP